MTLDLLVKLRHDMVVVQMVYPKKLINFGGIFPGSEFVAHRLYQITFIFCPTFKLQNQVQVYYWKEHSINNGERVMECTWVR